MADKKPKTVKRIVVHPKYYMAVAGKLQHIKPGTEITCSKKRAERHKLKLADPADKTELKDGEIVKGSPAESEAVAALTVELGVAEAETAKAVAALTSTATKLDAAQKEVKALKAAAKK